MTGRSSARLLDTSEFGAIFDAARHSVFRLESHQTYSIPADDEELIAFRTGAPRPERSVRTSPWLARIARQTVTCGIAWSRVRVVEFPLTEYTRFELVAYVESQAAGEEIRLLEAPRWSDDFWLIDRGTDHAVGVWMRYDEDGHLLGRECVDDVEQLATMDEARLRAWEGSRPLNVWSAAYA